MEDELTLTAPTYRADRAAQSGPVWCIIPTGSQYAS